MNRTILFLTLFVFFSMSFGQSMKVHTKGTSTPATYPLSDIDSITFELASSIPSESLFAFLKFDNDFLDASGKNHDGTQNGSPSFVADRWDVLTSAVQLNGHGDYVDVSNSSDFDCRSDFSISIWINPVDTAGPHPVISKMVTDGSYNSLAEFDMQINTHYAFFMGNGITNTGTNYGVNIDGGVPVFGKWNHLAATIKADSVKFYVNGALAGEALFTGGSRIKGSQLIQVGRYFNNGQGSSVQYFKGKIDDCAIYSRALTATEVLAIYNEKGWTGN